MTCSIPLRITSWAGTVPSSLITSLPLASVADPLSTWVESTACPSTASFWARPSRTVNITPAVLFAYRKDYEPPSTSEGFIEVTNVPFVRRPTGYKNKALWLDYDGCLRRSRSGKKWPTDPDDVETLVGRSEVLKEFVKAGFLLLGASNQSAIAKGELTAAVAEECFRRTNEMLGVDIEIGYCPHRVPPITCYCRKPMPGMGVHWLEKYKLDNRRVVMVGDMTTDRTFAARCGVQFCDCEEFFRGGRWRKFLDL